MNALEFNERLRALQAQFNADVVKLVHEAQESNGLGIDTTIPLEFHDDPTTERIVDDIACMAGWIADRLKGINRLHRKSLTKKIRRALGYTSP